MFNREHYVQKVHLHKNNRDRTNRKGGKVDDTLCASNHGNHNILTTEDETKVTCMRCLKHMRHRAAVQRGKDNFMGTVKMGSPEHLETVRAPLKNQIEQQARTIAELQEEQNSLHQRLGDEKRRSAELVEREKALVKRLEMSEHNNAMLKDQLMKTELAYSKLVGYVEGMRDSAPPRMVPEQREGHFPSYPDGTMPAGGQMYNDVRGGMELRNWWNR